MLGLGLGLVSVGIIAELIIIRVTVMIRVSFEVRVGSKRG